MSASNLAREGLGRSWQILVTVQSGLREIWAHKFRSLLTMLGIILGVSSLVAMSALVAGMEKGAKESLVAIGGLEKVRVEAQDVPIEQRHLTDDAIGITINDVYALRRSAPLVTRTSPEMRLWATVSAHDKKFRPWFCCGVWPAATAAWLASTRERGEWAWTVPPWAMDRRIFHMVLVELSNPRRARPPNAMTTMEAFLRPISWTSMEAGRKRYIP